MVVFFLDLSGPGCTLHSSDIIASLYLLQSGHWAGALLEPRKHLKERKRKCFDQLLRNIFYNISDTVAHLLVLSSPGTTLVLLLFGALNSPFTCAVWCRGANVVGCLSYSQRLFHNLIISLAWVLDKVIFPSFKETKYTPKAWTSQNPSMLSGPAES